MMSVQQSIGKHIRMYRKLRGLSLEELAAKIYKSKSIVSKYELGQSNMDVATLYEIADALEIDVRHLLDIPRKKSPADPAESSRFSLFTEDLLFLYILEYDRRKPVFHRGILTLSSETDGRVSVSLYMDTPDIHDYTRCQSVYQGHLICSPYNGTISLRSSLSPDEILVLFASINRSCRDMLPGFYNSYSLLDNVPCSTNMILSRFPLQEDEALQEALTLSRNRLTQMKHGNVCIGNDFIDETALHRAEQPAAPKNDASR